MDLLKKPLQPSQLSTPGAKSLEFIWWTRTVVASTGPVPADQTQHLGVWPHFGENGRGPGPSGLSRPSQLICNSKRISLSHPPIQISLTTEPKLLTHSPHLWRQFGHSVKPICVGIWRLAPLRRLSGKFKLGTTQNRGGSGGKEKGLLFFIWGGGRPLLTTFDKVPIKKTPSNSSPLDRRILRVSQRIF